MERRASSWQTLWNDVAVFSLETNLIKLEIIRALRSMPASSVAFQFLKSTYFNGVIFSVLLLLYLKYLSREVRQSRGCRCFWQDYRR